MKKSLLKPIRRRRIFVVVALVLCVYFAFSIVSNRINLYKDEQVSSSIEQQVKQQQLTNDELERIIQNGGSEEYIERIAREKLGYAAINERVFYDLAGS